MRVRPALLAGVSAETREGQARALLADLLDWHRREDKPAWWRYFYLRTLSPAELTGEPDALGGLVGGDMVGQVKKSVVRRFRFPPQEHKFSPGGSPAVFHRTRGLLTRGLFRSRWSRLRQSQPGAVDLSVSTYVTTSDKWRFPDLPGGGRGPGCHFGRSAEAG